jgi:exonuclease SbcD
MRVIHFADLHIGVETYGRPLPDRGWSSRMQDFLDAYDELVEFAITERADAVIFAGDAYKAREPTQTHQREFARRIRRLSNAGIATFLLVGNHDLPNAEGRAHALEIYRTLDVPNVYVGDNWWFQQNGFRPQVMETKAGPLQVAFLPWPQVSRLLAADEQVARQSIDEQMAAVETRLAALIRDQSEHLDPGTPAILACHISINDFLVRNNQGTEQWMTVGTAPTVLKSSLCEQSFDYIALGHHHNNLDLQMNTPCWYSGSMQRVDFGEEKQDKGFMVFDIETGKPRGARMAASGLPRLQKVAARRFLTIEVKPRDEDPTAEVCRAIEAKDTGDAIVRVEVSLTGDQARLFRIPEARRMLEKAHYVAGIRTFLPDDPRSRLPAGEQPDSASPIEVLDLYFRVHQMEDARRERLRRAAEDLMASTGVAHA